MAAVRRAAKIDAGQLAIVDALRAIGASVQSLAAVGAGVPDLLVGWRGVTLLLEVKQPPGPRGGVSQDGQHLGGAQVRWARAWRGGAVLVVRSPEQALVVVTGVTA